MVVLALHALHASQALIGPVPGRSSRAQRHNQTLHIFSQTPPLEPVPIFLLLRLLACPSAVYRASVFVLPFLSVDIGSTSARLNWP